MYVEEEEGGGGGYSSREDLSYHEALGQELNNHKDNDDEPSTCLYLLFRLIKLSVKFQVKLFLPCSQSPGNPAVS